MKILSNKFITQCIVIVTLIVLPMVCAFHYDEGGMKLDPILAKMFLRVNITIIID
jgi:fumarate reductase subunit D